MLIIIVQIIQNFLLTIQTTSETSELPEEAQGLVEYALILMFVSVVLVFLLTVLGPGITNIYSNILVAINGAGS